MKALRLSVAVGFSLCAAASFAVPATVLYGEKEHAIENAQVRDGQLLVSPADLERINGFKLKPEGACLDDLCVPVKTEGPERIVEKQGDAAWFNLTRFALKLGQPAAAVPEAGVWSFGPIPAAQKAGLKEGMAPDFELADVNGKKVKLSDFRGKRVLIVTWASWCGCRFDLPGWEKVNQELKGKNLEIISIAEDTGGIEAAGPAFKKANATYTQLVDPLHTVSSLYEMVNVPTGVWIDEEGKIVRPGEVAYVGKMKLGPVEVDGDAYVAALKDWADKGKESKYALPGSEIQKRIAQKHPSEAFVPEADVWFKLAAYLKAKGDAERAEPCFKKAQELNPKSWNYHRQDWSFLPSFAETMKNFNGKVAQTTRDGGVYYAPNDLSNPNAEANAKRLALPKPAAGK